MMMVIIERGNIRLNALRIFGDHDGPESVITFARIRTSFTNHSTRTGELVLDIPFEFPFYSQTFSTLRILSNGQILPFNKTDGHPSTFSQKKCNFSNFMIAPLCAIGQKFAIQTYMDNKKVVISWVIPTPLGLSKEQKVMQAVLTPIGEIYFHYDDISIKNSIEYGFGIGIIDGNNANLNNRSLVELPFSSHINNIWFDLNYGRELAIHNKFSFIALIMLLTIAAILFVVRPYIMAIVVQPIQAIAKSVKSVDAGKFDQSLNLESPDEFGDISAGFNKMTDSLNKTRHLVDEQTELLESMYHRKDIELASLTNQKIISTDEVFKQKLYDAIQKNLSNPTFQIPELADILTLSNRQLNRKTLTLTGLTPSAILRNSRLELSHELLLSKASNVSQAAYKSGFNDVRYFSTLFSKKFGYKPSDVLKSPDLYKCKKEDTVQI